MRAAALGLLLLGCGPVMLEEDARTHDAGTKIHAVERDARDASDAGLDSAAIAVDAGEEDDAADASARPSVQVSVKAIECGKCFQLNAEGSGGQPPYEFEWEDGSLGAKRRVCVENAELSLSVLARDAASARSAKQSVRLQGLATAACPPPPASTPPVLLCLENTSFEGTPAANLGQPEAFDASPWSACTNPSMANTPDIANDTIPQSVVILPKATDGLTYLALGEGEQVSQPFCSTIDAEASVSLALDLSRIDLAEGIVPTTEKVFLEIWGGLAVDCSQRELLWASPALKVGWKPYCVTLHPHAFMNQITLRANADMTLPSPAYLLVDNLKPMDSCP